MGQATWKHNKPSCLAFHSLGPARGQGHGQGDVRGMLRSRANTIEGGTSEIKRNVLAERVLGLPKEPDPWRGKPWRELPRS
jgi:hypothetical protein